MTAEKLLALELKQNKHDILFAQNAKTLEKVADVLITQAETNQQLLNLDKRFTEHKVATDNQLEKTNERVDRNHVKIARWSGGLAVAAFVIGLLLVLAKFIPKAVT